MNRNRPLAGDLATQSTMCVAVRPGARSLNPAADKPPQAFAFSSLLLSRVIVLLKAEPHRCWAQSPRIASKGEEGHEAAPLKAGRVPQAPEVAIEALALSVRWLLNEHGKSICRRNAHMHS